MKTFILLAFVWGASPSPDVYVIDHGLTGEDCIAGLMNPPKVGYDEDRKAFDVSNAEIACELDIEPEEPCNCILDQDD